MDAVFGPQFFCNEIIWKRHSGHSNATRSFASITDTILYYTRGKDAYFTVPRRQHDPKYVENFFRYIDEHGRRYRVNSLKNPAMRPNLKYEYKGYPPPPTGWTCTRERMEAYDRAGRLEFPKSKTGRIGLRYFLDDMQGNAVPNLWD